MQKLLLTSMLVVAIAGCTNDYGQFRFPPQADGGAAGADGVATGGSTATGGTAATGGAAATGGSASSSSAGGGAGAT